MAQNLKLIIEPLPGDPPPESLPAEFFKKRGFVLLESSLGGRYTIAAWEPREILEAREGVHFLEEFRKRLAASPQIDAPELPFAGGWIGFLSYELYDEILPKVKPRPVALLSKAMMAYYDNFYLYDHREERAYAVSVAGKGNPLEWPRTLFEPRSASPDGSRPVFGRVPQAMEAGSLSQPRYLEQVSTVKDLIARGDCYQVNLSQKFATGVSQSSSHIYQRLRSVSPSPYAAYLNLGDAQILSSSPELFLEMNGRKVITRPIKGTRHRDAHPTEDARLKTELASSEKDRAELLMITDLERNDLGRVCKPGSVKVSALREVETYPQVHHLVSTVEGELEEGRDVVDLLKATFPGGSITGAPKIRAMQVIRELEPHAREIYCGAIGFVGANGKTQFNIAIRTMVIKNDTAHFWSGAGIVADSDPESEYVEILVKASGLKKSICG